MKSNEGQKKWSNIVFAGLFAVALLLFGRIMLPFLEPVLLGGFLVVLFYPVHQRLTRAAPQRRALAAAITTLGVLMLIVVPLAALAFFVGREVLGVYDAAEAALEDPDFRRRLASFVPRAVLRYVLPPAGTAVPDTDTAVAAAMNGGAAMLGNILGAGTALAIDGFLMAVTMYYFFLDGRRLYSEAARLVPIERRYLASFAKEFKDVAYAIMYGNTLTAMVQGALGLVGLWIAGVPHPVMWAAAMAAVAIVPVGGTAIVWLPISAVLLLAGKTPQAIFLFGWGALVVSTIDNVIRPKLCGSRMALHPLLVFLSMFGGLSVFGAMGLLIGPLIAAIFMAMVRIYRRDYLGLTVPAVWPHAEDAAPATSSPSVDSSQEAPSAPPAAPLPQPS